eukprot:GGOE01037978.1.p1 GENE.GGOE01037978.1~~GGOE01037978.1.p1  ORF type:complete len:535 (-),score=119.94 GGOE01037978.1:456-2060(-)
MDSLASVVLCLLALATLLGVLHKTFSFTSRELRGPPSSIAVVSSVKRENLTAITRPPDPQGERAGGKAINLKQLSKSTVSRSQAAHSIPSNHSAPASASASTSRQFIHPSPPVLGGRKSRQYPLPWPPRHFPADLDNSLREYGAWHTAETRRLFASPDLQAELLQQICKPNLNNTPSALPKLLVAHVGGQGLGGSTSNAVDLLLVSLLTRRLFFLVSATPFRWDRWLYSPYFSWNESRVSPFVVAFEKSTKKLGYPFFVPGWSCNKWPLRLMEQPLDAILPGPFYAYNDGNKGHPWVVWLMANRHHRQRLQALGLFGVQHEVAHGLLQSAAFQPTAHLVPPLNRVLGTMTADTLIAVHFRTSGNPKWADPGRLGPSHIQCHLRCAVHLLEQLSRNGSSVQVYVAADRMAERQKATAVFQRRHAGVLLMQNLTTDILHVAKAKGSEAGFMECLVDFLSLAHCDRFLITKSSFSMLASFRAGVPFLANPFPKAHRDTSKCHDISWCEQYPTAWHPKFFAFGHKTGCRQPRQPPQRP